MKYKLICEYPGSPKYGFIQNTNNNGTFVFNGNDLNPLDYPEYWEKVEEKDYEILSFICNQNFNSLIKNDIISKTKVIGNNYIFEGKSQDGKKITTNSSAEELLEYKQWSIYSVKRLSDGEIFTIGDNTTVGIINKISLQNNNIKWPVAIYGDKSSAALNFEDQREINKGNLLLQHIKTPLFITEDGIDIFSLHNDVFWYLKKSTFYLYEKKKYQGNHFKYEPDIELYFSAKEKAEEYILFNKPCLSLNDISDYLKTTYRNSFKKLVKEKLNL